MSAIIRSLFEDTPRPGPLPTFPFPNDHPFAVRWKDLPGLPVPVGVGPLSTYHEHLQIPIPGDAFDRMEEVIAVPVDETEDVRKTPASTGNNGEKVELVKDSSMDPPKLMSAAPIFEAAGSVVEPAGDISSELYGDRL